jgi:glyoxylase-like metal-dependent hydrolase (beta-lactamase superfamily II)
MKTLWISVAIGALVLAGCGQTAEDQAAVAAPEAPAAPERSINQVAGDLYRFQNNQHFGLYLVTTEGVVVFDPINTDVAEWLKGEIASRHNGAQVAAVVYSHHHWDHAAGAAAFPGARVIGRPEMAAGLQGPAADAPLAGAQATADANGDGLLQSTEATGPLAASFAAIDKDANGGLSAREIFEFQYQDVMAPNETWTTPVNTLQLGGKTVELHHVGGTHAADSAYTYFPAEKALFVVDIISPGRLQNLTPAYDEAHQFSMLDKALSFDSTYVLGGHGKVGNEADVEAQRTYLTDLRVGVQAAIDAGQTVEQAKASVTLPQYADWIQYQERIGPNVEAMYAVLNR